MYERWPFWRTLIDNTQMILAKADLTIARLYADLVEDEALADAIFGRIEAEYRHDGRLRLQDHRPAAAARQRAGAAALDRSAESVRRSAELRAARAAQAVAARRRDRERLLTAVLESINGIAAGLKNTG